MIVVYLTRIDLLWRNSSNIWPTRVYVYKDIFITEDLECNRFHSRCARSNDQKWAFDVQAQSHCKENGNGKLTGMAFHSSCSTKTADATLKDYFTQLLLMTSFCETQQQLLHRTERMSSLNPKHSNINWTPCCDDFQGEWSTTLDLVGWRILSILDERLDETIRLAWGIFLNICTFPFCDKSTKYLFYYFTSFAALNESVQFLDCCPYWLW